MHPLAQRVLSHIRRQELLRAGDRVGVAVSGGIDSVALLRLLLELRGDLGIVLSVVHFNHKLRGAESDADEKFVAKLAGAHDLEFFVDSDDVAGHAREEGVSVEAAARELRYGFFRWLLVEGPSGAEAPNPEGGLNRSAESAAPPKSSLGLKPPIPENAALRGPKGPLFHGDGQSEEASANSVAESRASDLIHSKLDKIATGHTLDDQAETVLMRMIRGAGMRGLGGIYPRIPVEDDDGEIFGEILRPLLTTRRHELECYLKEIGQPWREDSTNSDEALTRNRVRRLVVPLLEKEFNPAVAENLAELAEIARGEEDYWENEIAGWMGTVVHWSQPEWAREEAAGRDLVQIGSTPTVAGAAQSTAMNASVSRLWLVGEPLAAQRRLIKAIGEQAGIPLEFRHVEEILRSATEENVPGRELSLPLGWRARIEPDELVFLTPDLRGTSAPQNQDYEYGLPIPGVITVNETGTRIEVLRVPAGAAGYNPDQLLDAESLRGPLRVRNWRPGDRFWPAHTKSPKKIKELLQERHVELDERKLWPLIVSGDEIIWVRGFQRPAKLRAKPGREAVLIVERTAAGNPTA